jgi:hypothetical protein
MLQKRMVSSFARLCKELIYIFEDLAETESNCHQAVMEQVSKKM